MPRARASSPAAPAPRARRSKATPSAVAPVDYRALSTEALNPRSELLDTLPPEEVVKMMVDEEATTVKAVRARAAEIGRAAQLVADRLTDGGRLIYVGAGTSGRLGTLDASECVPTFGINKSLVTAIIAGGPHALTHSVEGAEDDEREAEQRMRRAAVGPKDVVICIAASGVTPFVRAALAYAHHREAGTIFVACSKLPPTKDGGPPADVVIEVITGPEVVAGSTRLKAGTATKIILNAISTTTFVLLGKTYGGLMVDVRPTNAKLWSRATRIVSLLTGLADDEALALLKKAGGRAKVALVMFHARVPLGRAHELIQQHRGSLRAIIGDVEIAR